MLLAWAALTGIGTEPYDNEGCRVALVATMAFVVTALALAIGISARRTARTRSVVEERAAAERERADHAQRGRERRARETDRADRAGRHWTQELRREVAALHEARSALAPRDDLRSLVSRLRDGRAEPFGASVRSRDPEDRSLRRDHLARARPRLGVLTA